MHAAGHRAPAPGLDPAVADGGEVPVEREASLPEPEGDERLVGVDGREFEQVVAGNDQAAHVLVGHRRAETERHHLRERDLLPLERHTHLLTVLAESAAQRAVILGAEDAALRHAEPEAPHHVVVIGHPERRHPRRRAIDLHVEAHRGIVARRVEPDGGVVLRRGERVDRRAERVLAQRAVRGEAERSAQRHAVDGPFVGHRDLRDARRDRALTPRPEGAEALRLTQRLVSGHASERKERVGALTRKVEVGRLLGGVTNEHVSGAQWNRVVPEEEFAELAGDRERVAIGAQVDPLAGQRRDDQSLGAQLAGDDVGNVLGESSVDERLAVDHEGLEDEWNGERGAHGSGEVAARERDRSARAEIGGDGAERDRQRIEVAARDEVAAQQRGRDQRIDLALAHRAGLQAIARDGVAFPERERGEVAQDRRDVGLVAADDARERHGAHDRLDLAPRVAGGVQGAHDGANRCADDQVGADAERVQSAKDPRVREPLGTAAGEHEGRACRGARFALRAGLGGPPRGQRREGGDECHRATDRGRGARQHSRGYHWGSRTVSARLRARHPTNGLPELPCVP